MWPMRRIPAIDSVYAAKAMSRSPSDQAASPSSAWAAARPSSSSSGATVEHPARVGDGGGDVAAHQRQRGAVHLDRTRQVPAAARRRRRPCPAASRASGASASHCSASWRWASTRSSSPADIKTPTRPTASTGRTRTMSSGKTCAHSRIVASCRSRRIGRHRELGQRRGSGEVAGRERVPDRVGRLAVVGVPGARPAMELDRRVGVLVEEPRAQHVGEQVVVPVPLASIVERDHEQVLSVQRLERRLPAGRAGHRVAERPLQPVEDRRLQQEPPDGFGLALQHLAHQVVDDEAIVTGEAGDEARDVVASLHRQCRELQCGDPAFRARLQRRDVGRRQLEAHRSVQVLRRFLGGEAQVGGPDLPELAARSQAGQRQRRIGPARDHEVRTLGEVVEEDRSTRRGCRGGR